jgi:hypothetical protein
VRVIYQNSSERQQPTPYTREADSRSVFQEIPRLHVTQAFIAASTDPFVGPYTSITSSMDAGTTKQTRSDQTSHKEKTETAANPSQNDPIKRAAKTSQSGNAFLPA